MNKVLDKFRGDIIIPLIICEKCENSYELKPGESIEDFEAKNISVGVLSTENEDIRSLRQLVIYGVKGIAAYTEHAYNMGFEDKRRILSYNKKR